MRTELQFGKMARSGDGGWGRLHRDVSVINITELCASKHSRRNIVCYLYFTTIKKMLLI